MSKKQSFKRKSNSKQTKKSGISTAFKRPRHEKLEIKFDPEARREYLTSFSSKKKERRTFGLAMQKVKDRRAKLEDKRDSKKAVLQQIEEAERLKEQEMFGEKKISTTEQDVNEVDKNKKENITTFQDQSTQSQFGGQVIVTTTFEIPSDNDDDDNNNENDARRNVDLEQKYAG